MAKSKENNEFWSWIKVIVIALAIAIIIQSFIFTPMVINGRSMQPNLEHGNRIVVNKIGKINRFDIIVFSYNQQREYIKRIIGLPGDKIEYIGDVLYINGEKHEEPYLDELKSENRSVLFTSNFKVEEVSKGHVFVLGDNRRNSEDSRHIGEIKMTDIIGKPSIVYWPIKDLTLLNRDYILDEKKKAKK